MLIFDGDCVFCTTSAKRAEALLPLGTPVVPWQSFPDLSIIGLTESDVTAKVWWIGTDGRPEGGHRAVGRCIQAMRPWWSPIGGLLLIPPVSWSAAPAYAWVARHRHQMPGATNACRPDLGPVAAPDSTQPTGSRTV